MMTHRISSGRGARLRRALALASATLVLVGMAGCEDSSTGILEPVATVVLTSPSSSLVVGDSLVLLATLRGASGRPLSGRPVAWTSSDTTVATVGATGRVRGRKPGVATIQAASEGRSGSIVLAVNAQPVPAPTPAVTALVPAHAFQGADGVSIILVGQGFDHTSTVYWNGSPRPTHRAGSQEIQAIIPDTDLVDAGTIQIEVVNSNGSRSTALAFTIIPRMVPVNMKLALSPDPMVVVVDRGPRQMAARWVDLQGNTLPGTPDVVWWPADSSRLHVTPTGAVTGLVPGRTLIHAAGGGYHASLEVEVRPAADLPRATYQSTVAAPGGQVVDTILWSPGGSVPATRAYLVVRIARISVDTEAGTYVQDFKAYVRGTDGSILGETGWMEHGRLAYDWLTAEFVFTPANGAEVFRGNPGGYSDMTVRQKVRNAKVADLVTYVAVVTTDPT